MVSEKKKNDEEKDIGEKGIKKKKGLVFRINRWKSPFSCDYKIRKACTNSKPLYDPKMDI